MCYARADSLVMNCDSEATPAIPCQFHDLKPKVTVITEKKECYGDHWLHTQYLLSLVTQSPLYLETVMRPTKRLHSPTWRRLSKWKSLARGSKEFSIVCLTLLPDTPFAFFLSFSAYLECEWMAGELTALLNFNWPCEWRYTLRRAESEWTESGSLLIVELSLQTPAFPSSEFFYMKEK